MSNAPDKDSYILVDHGYYKEAVPLRTAASRTPPPVVPAQPSEQKAMDLPITVAWEVGEAVPLPISWDRLKKEGFNTNAAFGACVAAYALAFPEPPPKVMTTNGDDVDPTHPLQTLLIRPNPFMSHNELMSIIATFMLVGGNCYLHKRHTRGGPVTELWPYHDGHLTPIPGEKTWIDAYEYDIGDGRKERIDAKDIVHLKWPVVDLDQPWRGLSPLRQLAREVDADTEMTRIVWSALRNDAIMRTLITFPPGEGPKTPEAQRALLAQFNLHHGAERRGGVGIATGGADVKRIALNFQELDLSTLRHIPEARIAAVLRVPIELLGLYTGLEKSTYSNKETARRSFTEDTLIPLWSLVAGELEADLVPEFGGKLTVQFDVGQVRALQESQDALFTRALEGYDKDVLTKNEARSILGLPPVMDLERNDPEGDQFKSESAPPPPKMIDAIPMAPDARQLTDEQTEEDEDEGEKRLELKARRRRRTDDVTVPRLQSELEAYLKEQANDWATHVANGGTV